MDSVISGRSVIITSSAQKLDVKGVADILARYITGGDPAGYLRKIAEKQEVPAHD